MGFLKSLAATVATVVLTGAAQAALVARNGGMVYDTTLDITWMADMNHANTSGHTGAGVNASGTMGWDAATAWANNLVYGGFADWRLPTINPSDMACNNSSDPGGGFPQQYWGFDCTGGELGHLFVTDLGNQGTESVLDPTGDTAVQIANLALFSNVQSGVYWSGTAYAPGPNHAWYFSANNGFQAWANVNFNTFYAVAVRPGDVAASVPEPESLLLVLLALGMTVVVRRRRPG